MSRPNPLALGTPASRDAARCHPLSPGGDTHPLCDDTCTCNQCVVTDLARAKAVFQLRAVKTVMTDGFDDWREKVQTVAAADRRAREEMVYCPSVWAVHRVTNEPGPIATASRPDAPIKRVRD